MNFFTLGAIIIAAFFALNLAIFVFRTLFERKGKPQVENLRAQRLSSTQVGNYLMMVTMCVLGFALPIVSPESTLGRALNKPWALSSVAAWSMLTGFVIDVILRVARKTHSK